MSSRLKVTLISGLSLALLLAAALVLEVRKVPSFSAVKSAYKSADRALLDRNGLLIDELHRGNHPHRLNWVSTEDMPHAMTEGLLGNEAEIREAVVRLLGTEASPRVLALVWSKNDLIEAYLNLTVFRGELQGLEAASFGLFDKPPRFLTRAECALLLASVGQERVDSATVKSKACDFLSDMGAPNDCGLLPEKHLASLEKSYGIRPFMKLAPKLARHLRDSPEIAQGSLVNTTLDREMQWQSLHLLQKNGIENGGVVIIDNATGQVLAYVDTTFTQGDMRPHRAGSMLKPLLYAEALDERILTLKTPIENSVTLRAALASDSNPAALRALALVGSDNFSRFLSNAGLQITDESFGPSLALGVLNSTLVDLTNAYRALKTGAWAPLRFSPDKLSEQASHKLISNDAAFLLGTLLRDQRGRVHYAQNVGADHWAVGFSEAYTVGVWTGDGDAEAVWAEAMDLFAPVKGDVAMDVAPDNVERVGGAWYIHGTEPHADKVPSHIAYPQNRAQIDFEADMRGQPLLIQIASPQPDQNLYLNGHRLGRAKAYQPWAPFTGKFTLELRDSQGQVIDRVHFVATSGKSGA